jgi:hypothetical protein
MITPETVSPTAKNEDFCQIEGCHNFKFVQNLCKMHYQRKWRNGHTDLLIKTKNPRNGPLNPCSVDGCTSFASSKGMCKLHYGRFRRTRTTELKPCIRIIKRQPFCCHDGCFRHATRTGGLCSVHYNKSLQEQKLQEIARTGLKLCNLCKQEKPLNEFHKAPDNFSGLNRWCKTCVQNNNHAKVLERRNASLLRKYNMTLATYKQILNSQNNACKICEIQAEKYGKIFHVDHDHKTGNVRGLLCGGCNGGLGYFKDNQVNLRRAASYLNNFII